MDCAGRVAVHAALGRIAVSCLVADTVDGSGQCVGFSRFGGSDIARGRQFDLAAREERPSARRFANGQDQDRSDSAQWQPLFPAAILVQPEIGNKVGPNDPTGSKVRRWDGDYWRLAVERWNCVERVSCLPPVRGHGYRHSQMGSASRLLLG
jgi:hypothetical protein